MDIKMLDDWIPSRDVGYSAHVSKYLPGDPHPWQYAADDAGVSLEGGWTQEAYEKTVEAGKWYSVARCKSRQGVALPRFRDLDPDTRKKFVEGRMRPEMIGGRLVWVVAESADPFEPADSFGNDAAKQ